MRDFDFLKRIIVSLAIMMLALSCSTNQEELLQENSANVRRFEELNKSLKSYSNAYLNAHLGSQSKGSWGRFWDSVKADVYSKTVKDKNGNPKASTGISISASRKQWKDSGNKLVDYNVLSQEDKNEIDAMLSEWRNAIDSDNENFGYVHNAAILSLITGNEANFDNYKELAESTITALENIGVDCGDVSPIELAEIVEDFMENIYDIDDAVLCQRLIAKYPENEDEVMTIKSYFDAVSQLDSATDIAEFTGGFQKVIEESNITDEEKKEIQGSLSIAPASYSLWSKIDSLNCKY